MKISHGCVMITCAPHMLPISTHIQHHPSLEVMSVLVKQQQLCIVAVYRRPQLPLSTFIPLFSDYLWLFPHSAIPAMILVDFNDNQLFLSPTSALSRYMIPLGFSQLITMPTTDQGSLLDHITTIGLMLFLWMLWTHTILIIVPASYLYLHLQQILK